MQKNHATIYVTDKGFLVQSLVSAWQVFQRHEDLTDILIFLADIEPATIEKLKESFPQFTFLTLDSKDYIPPEDVYFVDNHVPAAALARLVIGEQIPEQYSQMLYMDGDTQILGDLTPLLTYKVPLGKIVAGSGGYWLENPFSPESKVGQYLSYIGQPDPQEYFNTGVLACSIKSWKKISREALAYFMEKSSLEILHHDQSAINAVCVGKRIHLPPAYNFHAKYADLYLGRSYTPKIVHFTGPSKPWLYIKLPWKPMYAEPYVQMLEAFPFLEAYLKKPAKTPQWRYKAHALKSALTGKIKFKTLKARRDKFLAYVQSYDFPIS